MQLASCARRGRGGRWSAGWLFLVVMLPTVIHVFCFTGPFIRYGSMRTRSRWGYVSFVLFLLCGMGLLLWRPLAAHYEISPRMAALGDEFGLVFDQLAMLTGGQGWDTLVAFGRFLSPLRTRTTI